MHGSFIIMSIENLNEVLQEWLNENPDLSKYLSIEVCIYHGDPEKMAMFQGKVEMTRQKQIMQLDRFNKTTLSALEQQNTLTFCIKKPKIDDSREMVKTYRIFKYLSQKIIDIQSKHFKTSKEKIERLLLLIKNPLIPQTVDLEIKEEEFFADILIEPPKLSFLMTKREEIRKIYHKMEKESEKHSNSFTFKVLQKRLKKIIENSVEKMNKKLHYLAEDQNQENFDQVMLNSSFKCKEYVDKFLSHFTELERSSFTPEIKKIADKICHSYKISNSFQTSCAFILFNRFIFAQAFSKSNLYFYPNQNNTLMKYASSIPCSYLDIPSELLGPHDPNDKLVDILGKNEFYLEAARHVWFACLSVNPIDMIYELHEAMVSNEKGALKMLGVEKVPMFAFETTFGLYIGAILLSGAPNFEEVADFLIDFTSSGISSEFEFALTTTKAAINYCESMIENIEKDLANK
ncbi:hypothetical protein TRFO_41585 [Tritrichomonas foetus]|uniref:VPS9 domain-containing protein n=1 Tax=Tritrichomonas foetus TaxID=1144522 RepID=A0A1J4KZU7_9EUKA|nr:hypothetical protein TRFO_41585 [Tritrichomonas foetus]|eukprot:OHT16771.1 hypothetical protein TRFO_41585 [Tritrichomonas foetus]